MIIKTIPTIKATERHPSITIISIFLGFISDAIFSDEIFAKKGFTFADGIFLKYFVKNFRKKNNVKLNIKREILFLFF